MNSEARILEPGFLHRLLSPVAPSGKSGDYSYDPEMLDRLRETYPPEMVEAINAVMRMINLSNLFGNTVDWVLYALSFGLLGGDKK